MQSNIHIQNSAEGCVVDIEGTIGVPEACQADDPDARVTTYEKFRDTVRRIAAIEAPEVVVNIRSTGGDVNDALLIHDALRALPGRVTTRCYGYTASAATLIAQAASPGAREISANALYLIHRSACTAEGNAEQMAREIELLRKTDERLAGIYAARSGRPTEEFTALMAENDGDGRWLTPAEAVAAGLADRIAGEPAGRVAALTGRIVRNWERLLTQAGLRTPPTPPAVRCSVRHAAEPAAESAGSAGSGPREPSGALRQPSFPVPPGAVSGASGQPSSPVLSGGGIGPTTLKPCEDPSLCEALRTANERAYADDARRFAKGNR